MEFRFAPFLISVVIGVVLFATVLIPIVDDATTTERTFTNDDYFITMDKIDSESSHIITWTQATNTKITVDGVDITPNWESVTIVAEENNLIRCSKVTGDNTYYLNMVGEDVPTGYGSRLDKSVTVTIEGGVITFAGVTSADVNYSATSTFTTGYCINPSNEGDYQYIMKTPTSKAYVLGDSEIYGIGYSNVGGAWNNVFSISGTIDDGLDVILVSTPLDSDPTISNETTVYTAVSGYKDLYQFEKETFDASYGGNTYALTYSFVIVPSEVTAELSQHMSDTEIALTSIIPLLVVIGLVIGVVAVLGRRAELF